MRRVFTVLTLAALFHGGPAPGDTLLAARTIRAQTVLVAEDIQRGPPGLGGLTDPSLVLGMETRVTLYAGRPIRAEDLAPPAVIERNQIVPLIYHSAILRIETEARALARAGAGEQVRVLNLSSRAAVSGEVQPDGSVLVKASR